MWRSLIKLIEDIEKCSYDHVFISHLPNRNKYGEEFDIEPWETELLKIKGRLFRGATSYPSRGSYRKTDSDGIVTNEPMLESTRMVVSFVNDDDLTEGALKEISDFLKRFGKETGQETVAFVIDGEMYYIDIK